jgi:hypothetical protein
MSRSILFASLLFATALVVAGAGDDGDVLVLDADNFDREVKHILVEISEGTFCNRVLMISGSTSHHGR